MIKQLAIATATLSLLAACASEPTVQTGDDAEVVMGNLHKVDNSRADLAYIGSAFIATEEANAEDGYKQAIVDYSSSDIVYTSKNKGEARN